MHLRLHDVATLTEAFLRAVLKMFVKRELMDMETAQSMLSWLHSGFHAHDGVWAAADDKEFTVRLARYCARNSIALGRMEYADMVVGIDIARQRKERLAGSINATALVRIYFGDGEFLRYVLHDAPLEGETIPDHVLQALLPSDEFGIGIIVMMERPAPIRRP